MTEVEVYDDADALGGAVAARLLERIAQVQRARGGATVVLTGGRICTAMYERMISHPESARVEWSTVDFWWGDERFLPAGDSERNETGARRALLDALPVDSARIHPMYAADGPDGDDPDAAAARYAADLARAADLGTLPRFDVLLLGVGEDGHVASIFPGRPAPSGTVFAVRDSPKPPPVRLSLTIDAINTADEVWLVASGADKADPVQTALAGGEVPAAQVHGVARTVWLLDRAAAAKL